MTDFTRTLSLCLLIVCCFALSISSSVRAETPCVPIVDLRLNTQCLNPVARKELSNTLYKADIAHLDMTNIRAADLTLKKVYADNTILSGARFLRATILRTSFRKASGRDADFRNSFLVMVNFDNASLPNSLFDGAKGQFVDFRGADLSSSSLRAFACQGCNFTDAILYDVDLSDALLIGCDFTNAHVSSHTRLPFSPQEIDRLALIRD